MLPNMKSYDLLPTIYVQKIEEFERDLLIDWLYSHQKLIGIFSLFLTLQHFFTFFSLFIWIEENGAK